MRDARFRGLAKMRYMQPSDAIDSLRHQMLLRTWELITCSFGSVHFHIIDIITNESNYFGVIIGGIEILCC